MLNDILISPHVSGFGSVIDFAFIVFLRFPQTAGKVITYDDLQRAFKNVLKYVDKSRDEWIEREKSSKLVNPDELTQEPRV